MRVTGGSGVRAAPTTAALLVALHSVAAGQAVRVGGEVRPRYEYRSPVAGSANGFASMRTRVELSSGLERRVSGFIQLQDVRFWGEESNTLTDFRADNFDLHQGYVELRSHETGGWRLRIGRQEVGFGEERLVGPVNWTQQGRSFDGLRAGRSGSFGAIDAFAFVLTESAAPGVPHESEFFGAYAQLERVAGGTVELYSLHTHVAGVGTNQATLGARYAAARGKTRYRIEGSYQLGDRDSATVRAFMAGARLGRMVADQVELTLWYDLLSGDPTPGDGRIGAFETLFATNHPFYGLADLFLDIPRHTGGLGLQDVAVKLSVTPHRDVRLTLDGHAFSTVRPGTLTSRRLGEELDLTARYRYSANVFVEGGASYVRDGPALRDLGRLTEDLQFLYVMLTAKW
ncbi:MAG TPA: alginate export family protein [Gemmatimonadales bacterium]|nr:alginate export family protein [Gemmatimonadales bacterium]